MRNPETQFDEFTLDFSITPTGILIGKTENDVLKFFADRWSSTLVFIWIGPFSANQFPMPTKNGFRLEDADDIPELVCGLMRDVLDLFGHNSQCHLLNTVWFDGGVEFTL